MERLNYGVSSVLCPFCDRPLPSRPSKRLKDQLEQLCKRVDLQARASDMNSSALYLPATDTALTCKRHRDESEIIPTGEAAGYPSASSVDWKEIMRYASRSLQLYHPQLMLRQCALYADVSSATSYRNSPKSSTGEPKAHFTRVCDENGSNQAVEPIRGTIILPSI